MESRLESLTTAYSAKLDEQNNRVLYILTLVTTLITPAQFLTGLWGMNFDEMPELHYHYGYTMFWCLCVASVLLGLALFWHMGMLFA